jgi:hypothetical protein
MKETCVMSGAKDEQSEERKKRTPKVNPNPKMDMELIKQKSTRHGE